MQFKKFSSLDNTYRTNLIEKVVDEGIPTDDWIVTEKVDGANFSFWCDGEQAKVASRNQFVDGTFYNCQPVINRYADKILSFCKENDRQVVIYGELYGDGIQKRVSYGERDFVGFDVHCLWSGSVEHKECAIRICEQIGIPFAPIIFKGTFTECLKIENTFKSLLTPDGYDGENYAEGVVIEPVDPKYFGNGSRVYFKNKTKAFSEKKNARQKTPKSETISEKDHQLLEQVLQYNTEQRVSNVLSKIGKVTNKDFGKILGLTVQDMFEDFKKDTDITLKVECEANWKHFISLLNDEVGKTVRQEFVRQLD